MSRRYVVLREHKPETGSESEPHFTIAGVVDTYDRDKAVDLVHGGLADPGKLERYRVVPVQACFEDVFTRRSATVTTTVSKRVKETVKPPRPVQPKLEEPPTVTEVKPADKVDEVPSQPAHAEAVAS